MQGYLQTLLKKAVERALRAEKNFSREFLNELDFRITPPPQGKMGDYSSNVALQLKSKFKIPGSTGEIAGKIISEFAGGDSKRYFDRPEEASGFINFRLSEKFLLENLRKILKNPNIYGTNASLAGEKIIIEFTDPNPFKEFHIGHLMSNAIGESIARIFEANGAEVKRVNYEGDVGLHVAKALYGLYQSYLYRKSAFENGLFRPTSNSNDLSKKVIELGSAYAQGTIEYEKNEEAKKEILKINNIIYGDSGDSKSEIIGRLYKWGRQVSLDYFDMMYRRLGTKFDFYFFESGVGKYGKEVVLEFLEKGVFEKSENAIVFRGEKRDPKLHTRVFVNSQGLPVYETKELGLAKIKYDQYPYDRSIVVTGNEIKEYFKVLLAAMKEVFPELAQKTFHLPHGMMRLPTGKMSSRTGDVITAAWLIEEVKKKVLTKIAEREMAKDQQEKIAEVVAVGAIKYSILKQDSAKDIIFDFEKSLSFEGDSGPYLQYTHTRARSVLRKARAEKVEAKVLDQSGAGELARMLARFPAVVARASLEYSPHHIAGYLQELSSRFNRFYAEEKIVDPKDPVSPHKVALTKATASVLKNGLGLLGIEAPEEM
ncbi:MAG: arginine--tRNA ligase [Candidatus Doudnabacteria bacterium]|nr:arginine--tRNA ligase [Candidatus Doudnabacteria bacterium]